MGRTAAGPPMHHWSARCRLSHCRLCHRSLRCWSFRLQSSRLRTAVGRPAAGHSVQLLCRRNLSCHFSGHDHGFCHRSYDLSRRCQPSRPPSWPRPRPAATVTVTAAAVAAQPLAATQRCREPLTGFGRHVAATSRGSSAAAPPTAIPAVHGDGSRTLSPLRMRPCSRR